MTNHDALQRYRAIDIECELLSSTPHRVVQMLMEGVMERLSLALGCMQRADVVGVGKNITQTIDLIGELRASLDFEQGADIATRLDGLYVYMTSSLLEAQLDSDSEKILFVRNLMSEIKGGWDGLPVPMPVPDTDGALAVG